ncbi:SUMF1/EgtB/PvdO family nonheme iron enzyme [Anabaena sp. WFMT]|uniref:SUMF1/EgtB/PvdO family nonheme iron enzyme n=1 Tax=Anabaena sp. WFMT TaxID=3449730 RepID=UPI003F208094
MNNPQQPREYDAVLGDNSPSLEGAAVLGGIEGVKLRLQNPDLKVRIATIKKALNYGEQSLDLVIEALNDESVEVKIQAYLLLNNRIELKARQALLKFNPQGFKLEQIEVVTVNNFGTIIQRQQHIARYFIEDLGNGVNLEMAAIPAGSFMMGSPKDELQRTDSEYIQHQVSIQAFYIGKYTVTQEQWERVAELPNIDIDLNPRPSGFSGKKRPVECVSWLDAQEFCARLSKYTDKKYRLPTEAEWEYACKAGTNTPFYFGETITTDLVNYCGKYMYNNTCTGGVDRKETTDVGNFLPNAFGLYDMHGNIWEWCEDAWTDDYKSMPKDESTYVDNSNLIDQSNFKLARGGSWYGLPSCCCSAFRNYGRLYSRFYFNGFRLVVSAERTL